MALIKCPECNNDVSDKAASCPRCGFPLLDVDRLRPEEQPPESLPHNDVQRILADCKYKSASSISKMISFAGGRSSRLSIKGGKMLFQRALNDPNFHYTVDDRISDAVVDRLASEPDKTKRGYSADPMPVDWKQQMQQTRERKEVQKQEQVEPEKKRVPWFAVGMAMSEARELRARNRELSKTLKDIQKDLKNKK